MTVQDGGGSYPARYRVSDAAVKHLSGLADWRSRAACRDADPDVFFPEGTAGPALQAVDRAKRLCEACPVQARCLDWALDHHAAFGIWGGLTEGERRDLRQALTREPARVSPWRDRSGNGQV